MDTSEQTNLDETPKRIARRRRSVEEKRRIVEETLDPESAGIWSPHAHTVSKFQVLSVQAGARLGT